MDKKRYCFYWGHSINPLFHGYGHAIEFIYFDDFDEMKNFSAQHAALYSTVYAKENYWSSYHKRIY